MVDRPDKYHETTYLNLSGMGLTQIPEWIGDCINLEHIDLYNNNIKYIPHNLVLPNNLKYLSLSCNNIRYITSGFKYVTNASNSIVNHRSFTYFTYSSNNLPDIRRILIMHHKARKIQRVWRRMYYSYPRREFHAQFASMPPPVGLEWWGGGVLYRNMMDELYKD